MNQMVTKNPTPAEVSESLTGFDEIAIKQKFGATVRALMEEDPTQFMRALVFVLLRREEQSDTEAFQNAQNLTLGQVTDRFTFPKTKAEKAEADFGGQPQKTTP